jgi:hypothetical protein
VNGMGSATLTLVVLKTRQLGSFRRFYSSRGVDFVEEQHDKGRFISQRESETWC